MSQYEGPGLTVENGLDSLATETMLRSKSMTNKFFLHQVTTALLAIGFLGCGKDKPEKPEKKIEYNLIQYSVKQPIEADFFAEDSVLNRVGEFIQQGKVAQVRVITASEAVQDSSSFDQQNSFNSYCLQVRANHLVEVYEDLALFHRQSLREGQLSLVESCAQTVETH